MNEYFPVLSRCQYFSGIEQSDLKSLIGCLGGKIITVLKGEPVFLEGDSAQLMGVVLSGTVQVVQDDYYGNRSVLSNLQPGETFGEAFSCAGLNTMPVSVVALKDSEVLLLNCQRVLMVCSNSCRFHSLLIKNLLQEIAQKNLVLTQKIQYMSKKTTKEKLMAYLLEQAKQQGSAEFVIPFDRQSLADYLSVDRSAMSAEISKLKKEGMLDTKGSWFCLKQSPQNY